MSITDFLNKLNRLVLNPLIGLIFSLAVAYFIFGLVKFLSHEVGDKERDDARKSMIWGIVGMVVIFSVFGLIRFVLDTFGITPPASAVPYLG